MKFGYKFSNLLGTVYRSGDIVFTNDGNTLICPVGNKLSLYDLANNRSITLPIEARFDYTTLALSPNGRLLIAAQDDGELHIINVGFKRVIYRKRIKGKVQRMKFSPCGRYFAVAKHRTVFIYSTPNCSRRVYDPFSLKRVYDSAYDEVLSLDWSHDSRLLCFGAQDMSVHVCGFTKFQNLRVCSIGGHTDSVVGVYFEARSYHLITVTKNGHVNVWSCSAKESDLVPVEKRSPGGDSDEVNIEEEEEAEAENDEEKKEVKSKHKGVSYSRKHRIYLNEFLKGSSSVCVTSTAYRKESQLLVTAFSSGDFLLIDMTEKGSLIHSLNVSDKAVSSICLNSSGDWIALGVESSGELLVWEWQSETHVLKQKGHFNAMRVVTYSPDGVYLATGGEDGKLKIWSTQSSFCFVTFPEHSSEVTGVVFTQSGKAVVSSSLDGTVRAFDMIRYRNFKTMTSPKATQFSCVAVDTSGELVVAGGQDIHDIFLWSLQTGKLLEILGGHSGPVVSIQFSPELGSTTLLSTAWDKSVKVWDAIANTTARETITLLSEGTCVAFRMDGLQLAVATMEGHITMFDVKTLRQEKTIEGRNNLGAGRTDTDKVTAKTNLKTKFFNSLCYSADGKYIIAAGKSKFVCIYSIDDELLLKRFEITQNRSFDGMDKIVSRRNLADDGSNIALVEQRKQSSYGIRVPGSTKGAGAEGAFKPEIRVTSLAFSKTGRSWAACTTEGLLAYSMDDDWLFDPLQLDENNTPEAVRRRLGSKQYSTALMMSLKLNIKSLIMEVLEQIPPDSIGVVVDSLSVFYVESVIKSLANLVEKSRHIGFYSFWVVTILERHGQALKQRAPNILSELSDLQKALTAHYDNLGKICNHNDYTLKYLLCQAKLRKSKSSSAENEIIPQESTLMSSDEEEASDTESLVLG